MSGFRGYHPRNIENTMSSGIGDSCWRSRMNLARRYAHIDIETAINEICYYVKRHFPQNLDPKNKYMTAARCIYPDFGSVGLNRDSDFVTVAYYWAAANDDSVTQSSVQDRLNVLVKALNECQRNPDLSTIVVDMPAHVIIDRIICARGVYDKLAEYFTHLHPDTTSVDVQNKVVELARGFIAELFYNYGGNYASLVSDALHLDINAALCDGIKTKIRLIMQMSNEYDVNVQRYIDGVFSSLDYLAFCNHNGVKYTEDQINDLIKYANTEYNIVMRNPTAARPPQDHNVRVLSEEELRKIKSNIRQLIPVQNDVASIDHLGMPRYMSNQPMPIPAPTRMAQQPAPPLWVPRSVLFTGRTFTPINPATYAPAPTPEQNAARREIFLANQGV